MKDTERYIGRCKHCGSYLYRDRECFKHDLWENTFCTELKGHELGGVFIDIKKKKPVNPSWTQKYYIEGDEYA